jgi:CHAT domain-containing protein/tetratricopeptide (TPR) repeat protein
MVIRYFAACLAFIWLVCHEGDSTFASAERSMPRTAAQQEQLKRRDEIYSRVEQLLREGNFPEAIAGVERVLAIEQEVLGDDTVDVFYSLEWLAKLCALNGDSASAANWCAETLAIHKNSNSIAGWRAREAQCDRQFVDQLRGMSPKQLKTLREAWQLHARTEHLVGEGRLKEAVPFAAKALQIRRKLLGEDSAEYLTSLHVLGYLYGCQQEPAKAEAMLSEVLEKRRKLLGEVHPLVAATCNALGSVYVQNGDYPQAEVQTRRAADIARQAEGSLGANYAQSLNNLAEVYVKTRDYRRAEALRRELVEIRKQTVGPTHVDYAAALVSLQNVETYLRNFDECERLLQEALAIYRRERGETDRAYFDCLGGLAYIYGETKQIDKAIPLQLQYLEAQKRLLGPTDTMIGVRLNHLSDMMIAKNDYAKALEYERQAMEIFRKNLGKEDERCRTSLENLGWILDRMADDAREREDYGVARKAKTEAIRYFSDLYGADHWLLADERFDLTYYDQLELMTADQHRELGKAEDLCEEARKVHNANPREAIPKWDMAHDIYQQILGSEHRWTNFALTQLGNACLNAGDIARAEPIYVQAPEIALKIYGERHPNYFVSVHNLAYLYEVTGDLQKAKALYEQALQVGTRIYGEEHKSVAGTLNSLAVVNAELGKYAQTEQLHRKALDIRRRTLNPNDPSLGHSYLNLGSFYASNLGDKEKAEPLLQKAIEIYQAGVGEKHPDFARGINLLAGLYLDMDRFNRAEELYQQALAIRKETLGDKHPEYANTLHNLGLLHSEKGDIANAETYFLRALEIKRPQKTATSTAVTLQCLASLYVNTGRYREAESATREAVEIYRTALGEKSPSNANCLSCLARIYALMGDAPRGLPLALQALHITNESMEQNAGFQSERQQLAVRALVWRFLSVYLQVAAMAGAAAEDMYAETLNWKGDVGARQQQMRRFQGELNKSGNQDAIRIKAELDEATRSLAYLSRVTAPDPDRRFRLEELSEKIEGLQRELATVSAEYQKQREQQHRTPDDIRRALPRDAALIDFLSVSEYRAAAEQGKPGGWANILIAFIVRADQPVQRVELGRVAPIEEAIAAWRARFGPAAMGDDPGAILRRLIWEPLEQHIAGARVVLISPNSLTAPIAWPALPGQTAGSYLIDEYSIATVAIPRLLPDMLLTGDESSSTRTHVDGADVSLLVVGDVDFDSGRDNEDASAPIDYLAVRGGGPLHWSPLPGTRPEVEAIQISFHNAFKTSKSSLLTRSAATTGSVRSEIGKHKFLHFSTHGFFAPPEIPSAAAGEPIDDSNLVHDAAPDVTGVHPGLLSGLVLAGANRPDTESDDGILTALEVAEMDLSNVELATLSACETGLGQSAGGEGLLGLQRAFQTAGAKTVVASLWKVPDRATQLLMTRFYDNLWQRRMTKLEALREAQRWLMREGPKQPGIFRGVDLDESHLVSPGGEDRNLSSYYWAAFVLSGDWR